MCGPASAGATIQSSSLLYYETHLSQAYYCTWELGFKPEADDHLSIHLIHSFQCDMTG